MSPHLRVPDEWKAITDPKSYESYTCLESGTRFDAKNPRLERGPSGELVWGWKPDTDPIDATEERDLIARGSMKAADALFPLLDPDSGSPTGASPSSITWNAYRGKWIMLAEKTGAVYYAESDDPVGPWRRARKIVSHKAYNFYNVVQHPFFDQRGGRTIYFEGTYTSSFSDAKQDTPRYNHNQLMYRLRLDDPRLRAAGAPIAIFCTFHGRSIRILWQAHAGHRFVLINAGERCRSTDCRDHGARRGKPDPRCGS